MAVSVDQCGKALVASGLMSADELKAFWSALSPDVRPKDGAKLAQLLVDRDKLTAYQAQEILAGRGARLSMGDYVILQEIGAGGMGQVYKARHNRMERIVALKVMSAAGMNDEAAVKRFQREVRAAARLEHPNIVTAYDSGEVGNVKYLVMQFVDGGDLSSLVRSNGPLEIERAVDFVVQAARGLAFAHGEGVIHRDIKPANLLLDKKGVVKILDMGLARIESGDDGLTATEQVMGTVDYMSPEQGMNTKAADGRADIYSLGCTLWYLLTARKLYDGDSMIARLMAHKDGQLPSLVKTRDDASWALEQVLHKMIAKRPQDRYQSMDEVVEALAPFGSSGGSSSGMGSGIGLGSSTANAELASFLKSVGPVASPTMKSAPSKTDAAVEPTAQFTAATADTDPKSEILPPPKPAGKLQQKGSGGKKPPPKSKTLLMAGAGGAVLLVLLGFWFIFRDENGNEIARVQVPEGGSVTMQANAVAAKPLPIAMPNPSAASLFPAKVVSGSMFTAADSPPAPPPPGDYALLFEGDGYVDFDEPLPYDPLSFTVEAWVRVDVPERTSFVYGLSEKCKLGLSGNGANWSIANRLTENGDRGTGFNVSAELGRRYHIAAVNDLNRLSLYIDGKLVKEKTFTEPMPVVIPRKSSPRIGWLFKGLIDELRVSSVGRYGADFTPPTRHSPDADTLALYHFDEGFRDVLIDSSGNKRDGRIFGAKWVKADGSPIPTGPAPSNKLPSAEIVAPSPDGFVYLDDLKSFGWTGLPARLQLHGLGYNGVAPFEWNGTRPSHSLFMIPADNETARLSFPLDGRYETFVADVGTLSGVTATPLTFRVIGDGRELWKSKPINKRNETDSFFIPLQGTKELRLEVDCPGSSQHCHAVWIAPRLTPASNPPSVASPPSGDYALYFDDNDIVEFDDEYPYSVDSCTVEAFVRVDAPRKRAAIYAFSGNGYLGLDAVDATTFVLNYPRQPNADSKPGYYGAANKTTFELGRRMHVAGVFDKDQARLYVDGKQIGMSPPLTNQVFKTTGRPPTIGNLFLGTIDELRVSKTPRYNADFTPSPRLEPDADTTALYHFDEGQGTQLIDSSGNKHHGHINGAKWVEADGSPIPP